MTTTVDLYDTYEKCLKLFRIKIEIFLVWLFTRFFTFGNKGINAYVTTLINQWIKAFGKDHVMAWKSVKKKLEKVAKSYYNHVYNKGIAF